MSPIYRRGSFGIRLKAVRAQNEHCDTLGILVFVYSDTVLGKQTNGSGVLWGVCEHCLFSPSSRRRRQKMSLEVSQYPQEQQTVNPVLFSWQYRFNKAI